MTAQAVGALPSILGAPLGVAWSPDMGNPLPSILGGVQAVAWQPVAGAVGALPSILGSPSMVAAQPHQAVGALPSILGSPKMVAQGFGDLWASYGLPLPNMQGYGYKSAFQLQRTTMSSGFTRQRRKWSAGYRQIDATFELRVDQLPTLSSFLDAYGYDWFPMSLVTGEVGSPQRLALYVALDRSDSMVFEAEPGVTRLDVVTSALREAMTRLEPRIASGDLVLDLHASAFIHRGWHTRKWTGYAIGALGLADFYDWLTYLPHSTVPPTTEYRTNEIDGPVPQEILDELTELGLPVDYSTSVWAGTVSAEGFFASSSSGDRTALVLGDGVFRPSTEMPAAKAELDKVAGLATYCFLVGVNTVFTRSNMAQLDNTPQDGVPYIEFGEYAGLLDGVAKTLPVRQGAFVKTVRVMADPQFSDLNAEMISVTLKLEVQ